MPAPRVSLVGTVFLAAVAFLGGVALASLPHPAPAPATPVSGPAPPPPPAGVSSAPAAESELGRDTLATPPPPRAAIDGAPAANDDLAASRILAAMLGEHSSRLYFRPINEDERTLTPEAIALLAITPHEQQSVEAALARASEAMRGLARANIRVVSQEKDKAVLFIPPMPEGKPIGDALSAELARNLGPDRASVLRQRLGKSAFLRFGSGDQTLEFEWKEQYVRVTRSYKDRGSSGRSVGSFTELPTYYEELLVRP